MEKKLMIILFVCVLISTEDKRCQSLQRSNIYQTTSAGCYSLSKSLHSVSYTFLDEQDKTAGIVVHTSKVTDTDGYTRSSTIYFRCDKNIDTDILTFDGETGAGSSSSHYEFTLISKHACDVSNYNFIAGIVVACIIALGIICSCLYIIAGFIIAKRVFTKKNIHTNTETEDDIESISEMQYKQETVYNQSIEQCSA
jgi:hypothetical protein